MQPDVKQRAWLCWGAEVWWLGCLPPCLSLPSGHSPGGIPYKNKESSQHVVDFFVFPVLRVGFDDESIPSCVPSILFCQSVITHVYFHSPALLLSSFILLMCASILSLHLNLFSFWDFLCHSFPSPALSSFFFSFFSPLSYAFLWALSVYVRPLSSWSFTLYKGWWHQHFFSQ